MSEKKSKDIGMQEIAPRVSEFKRFRRVFLNRGLVVFGMVIILIFLIVAIFAPFLALWRSFWHATVAVVHFCTHLCAICDAK